jgi:hypothetical protein
MSNLRKWLFDKTRLELLKLGGGALVIVIGASWTVFKFFKEERKTPQQIEATYNVCVGDYQEQCPLNTIHLRCGESIAAWAARECASYEAGIITAKAGGMCGYAVTQIKCTVGK